jgi:hypothetical protein
LSLQPIPDIDCQRTIDVQFVGSATLVNSVGVVAHIGDERIRLTHERTYRVANISMQYDLTALVAHMARNCSVANGNCDLLQREAVLSDALLARYGVTRDAAGVFHFPPLRIEVSVRSGSMTKTETSNEFSGACCITGYAGCACVATSTINGDAYTCTESHADGVYFCNEQTSSCVAPRACDDASEVDAPCGGIARNHSLPYDVTKHRLICLERLNKCVCNSEYVDVSLQAALQQCSANVSASALEDIDTALFSGLPTDKMLVECVEIRNARQCVGSALANAGQCPVVSDAAHRYDELCAVNQSDDAKRADHLQKLADLGCVACMPSDATPSAGLGSTSTIHTTGASVVGGSSTTNTDSSAANQHTFLSSMLMLLFVLVVVIVG